MNRRVFLPALLWAVLMLPASAQADQSKEDKAELARQESEAKLKQLKEISELKDEQQKRHLLEKYLEENPNGPHLATAYWALFWPLYRTDAAQALEVAERLLQRVPGDDTRLRTTGYQFKYEALKKLKKEAEVAALSRHILETETNPVLLIQTAQYDKAGAPRFYEKAVREKRKSEDSIDSYPTLSDLLSRYARALGQNGDRAESIERMAESIRLDEAKVEELQGGDDKNRSLTQSVRGRISENYVWLAEMHVKSADGRKGLEALEKAEQAVGSIPLDRRAWFLKLRGEAYDALGDRERAFEAYARYFAVRMEPEIWRRIETISRETGRRDQEVMAWITNVRRTDAQPFKSFELKNLQGETKSFNDFKQKATLVNFFSPT